MIIWGNAISTNTSRPDYAETNEELASFIKNKPDAAIKKAQDTADLADAAAGKAQKAADDAQKTADSKVAQITAEIVLTASGWSGERQTVTVEGVTTINTVFIAPALGSMEAFEYYEITCVKQGNGNLTFSCEGEPDTDITLNVVILDVTVSPESGNPAVPGEYGGYYIPRVTQIDATTVRFEFTPSETDMPAVDPVTVTLPAGTGGGGSADLTGYATEVWVKAGYQPKGDYLLSTQLGSAIDTALAQAKGTGDFDGPAGQRGTGILNTTTGIASYTTAVGGVSPKYRILLSTLKTQATVNEVLVGDTVRYSTFLYPVIYVDSEYAYMADRVTIQGTAGTSVTVKSVTESSESGGSNVVTFSDNKTLTVKNGKDGRDPVRGTDYWTDADQEAIVQQVTTELGAPDYVIAEAAETAKKVLSHQSEDCFTLAWLSDLHIGSSYKVGDKWVTDDTSVIEAGQGLHEMSKTAPCDMIALGGDLSSGSIMTQHEDGLNQLDTAMEYMRPATFYTPTLYLKGNHDDVPYRATADRLTRAELFSRFGRKNLLAGAVSNDLDKGCNYGYLDFENRKMRVINPQIRFREKPPEVHTWMLAMFLLNSFTGWLMWHWTFLKRKVRPNGALSFCLIRS